MWTNEFDVDFLRNAVKAGEFNDNICAGLLKALAEVERLQAEFVSEREARLILKDKYDLLQQGNSALLAEVENLRAELAAAREVLQGFAALCPWLSDDYQGLNDCQDEAVLLVTDWEVPPEDRDQITAGMIRNVRRIRAVQKSQG